MKSITRDRIATLRYRHHYTDVDQRQIRIVIAATTITVLLTTRNDFNLLPNASLYPLLAVRLAHLLMTVGMLVFLANPRSLRNLERLTSTWNLLSIMMVITIGLSRIGTREVSGPFLGAIAIICIFYFAQRGFLLSRMVCCFAVTAGFIERLSSPEVPVSTTTRTTGIILLLLLNVLGIATARTFEKQRQARYEAKRDEKRVRLELMAKNRELETQKSRAEALYRARTAFLAAMSHEFRTPMNAVIGLSDVLVNAPLAQEYRDHARVIRESASSLLVLLNDILDFAKIDADKLELSAAPFNLKALLDSVVDMMRPAARAKHFSLETRFTDHLPEYVLGDDARLRQVLVNLLSNAIKFTTQGSVTFVVASKKLDDSSVEIEFTVQDTGIGMSPEVLERLFRPFEQGDSGINRRFGGTGLGLVISQKIVQALGAEINVESEVGKGSTFSFVLRMKEMEAPARHALSPALAPRTDHGSVSILVVDDLSINRMVAKVMLERLGYRADFAEDGFGAVEAIATKSYDIVLMDLQMPGMSGIEATKAIVEKLGSKRLPAIIAMSAAVFEEDRLACRNVGMCDFIAKPIDIKQLDDTLTRWTAYSNPEKPNVPIASSFNSAALDELRELETADNPNFVAELCRDFVADVPKRIQTMTDASSQGDWKTVEREAHGLKSSAATLGAVEMSRICAAIEVAARSKELENTTMNIEVLKREFPNVQRALAAQGYS